MSTLLLFAVAAVRLLSVSDPGYPPNAVGGATIVAECGFTPGLSTDVRLLSGEGAFAESAQSALSAWRFDSRQKGTTTVVVYFRDPNFYSTGNAERGIAPPPEGYSLAYPRTVVDPPYPADSQGQGSVVLRADITAEGAVSQVAAVRGVPSLTQPSLAAVRNWRFLPARNASGRAVASSVYVVVVFRLPVIAPVRPPE